MDSFFSDVACSFLRDSSFPVKLRHLGVGSELLPGNGGTVNLGASATNESRNETKSPRRRAKHDIARRGRVWVACVSSTLS